MWIKIVYDSSSPSVQWYQWLGDVTFFYRRKVDWYVLNLKEIGALSLSKIEQHHGDIFQIGSVHLLILILVFLALLKRLRIALVILKEASKAVGYYLL